jgi:hypothetical protein
MSLREGFWTLVHWYRESPMDSGGSIVEEDHRGFCASRGGEADEPVERWFAGFATREAMLGNFTPRPLVYHPSSPPLRGASP